ncbi:hypothetical protein ACFO0M_07390 [Micromonospora mangrovi]|uniref:Diadenosine tetraphosphate (Ap4A) hydrolase n=2 Tax=Micromonospora TaxID=1873 RepID=A0AAU7M7G3_9ACTN
MDITNFTESDLARLEVSLRLRDLSEACRQAVAAEETAGPDEPGLQARLRLLWESQVPQLQDAIARHVRIRGGSWSDIAALGALDEQEARERAANPEAPVAGDPVAEAAALDDWYMRHAQLEPLAQFRDPFSRLLSAHPAQEHECLICVKYRGGTLPAYGGYTSPPGGYLLDDGCWRVGHGPTPYWPAGTLLIESHRHFLDHAEMTPHEAATIGPLIQRFVGPLKEAMDAPRVHVFSCMEGAEHFHTWLVPRVGKVNSGRAFIAAPGHCSIREAEDAIARVRAALARAEAVR